MIPESLDGLNEAENEEIENLRKQEMASLEIISKLADEEYQEFVESLILIKNEEEHYLLGAS